MGLAWGSSSHIGAAKRELVRWSTACAVAGALLLCPPLPAAHAASGAARDELLAMLPSSSSALPPDALVPSSAALSAKSVPTTPVRAATTSARPQATPDGASARTHAASDGASVRPQETSDAASARSHAAPDAASARSHAAPARSAAAPASARTSSAPTRGAPAHASGASVRPQPGANSRTTQVGWEAGRLDYAYGAAEVAAFVNTPEQIQLQVVLCSLNEASPFRMSVLLPHTIANSGIIPVKLHVDGTVTHVYAEIVGNALEFQIDSAFLITLPDSPTFELEFSKDDAAFLKVPQLLSFPMERARLVLSEVAHTCKVLSAQDGFESSPQLLSGILWPRHGFNSSATLENLVQEDPERAQQLIAAEHQDLVMTKPQPNPSPDPDSPQEQARKSFNQRITHINGVPYLEPIDVDHACLRPADGNDVLVTHAPERFQLPEDPMKGSSSEVTAASGRVAPVGRAGGTAVPAGYAAPYAGSAAVAAGYGGAHNGRAVGQDGPQAGRAGAFHISALQEGTPTRHFAPSHWERRVAAEEQEAAERRSYSFVLSKQCRRALDQVYARTGQESLSFLRELFYAPEGSYQRYAERWRSVMQDSASMDFESPRATAERIRREGNLLQDYDYYLALYTLFSAGPEHLVQYPQSYYDIMHLGKDPATFIYAMDNRYELEAIKYASVLVRRLTGFVTKRRNVEEALLSWWSFYQELSALLPPIARAQALRPVIYRQMLMRLWRQAGYPETLHLRPEYAFVQGRQGRISTGESLEAQCSIFEGSNNDQFFFSSPECHSIIITDMRLLGYNNEDLRMVWRNWEAYRAAWERSPFAHNLKSDSAEGNLRSNFDLTLLSLYKTYGFGDYYLMRKCISSRDRDICAYETFRNKESYQNDVRRAIAALSRVSAREARSLGELHNLWQNYYESLCVFTNNLVTRGMLSPWRAPFIQGVAVTAQAEAIINALNPNINSDEF